MASTSAGEATEKQKKAKGPKPKVRGGCVGSSERGQTKAA